MHVARFVIHGLFATILVVALAVCLATASVWKQLEADGFLKGVLIVQGSLGVCFLMALWKMTLAWWDVRPLPFAWNLTDVQERTVPPKLRKWRRATVYVWLALAANTLALFFLI